MFTETSDRSSERNVGYYSNSGPEIAPLQNEREVSAEASNYVPDYRVVCAEDESKRQKFK